MRILTRYVFREFCAPLAYCLTGFISIYVLFELFGSFSRLMAAKPGFQKSVEYMVGYIAPYFEWIAPACLMLATLYTMWSFCRHSELIAMRASGIGFFAIVKPLLVAAALMAVFVACVNESYVPRHAQWAKQFRAARFEEDKMERSEGIVYHNSEAGRTWTVGMVMTPDAHALEDVTVDVRGKDGKPNMEIKARRVEYMDGQWLFVSPNVTFRNEKGEEVPAPASDLEKLTIRTFPGFNEDPYDFLLQNREWVFCSVADKLRYMKTHPAIEPEMRRDYEYDIYSKIVSPLACIIITLFAIPAGVATGRQSVFKGIVGALGMFFAFYGLSILFMIFAKRGLCPPLIAAVLPDIVFFGIGGYLFWRQR